MHKRIISALVRKSFRRSVMLAAVCVAVLLCGVSASAQPGDAADPLVSKNYVDGQIDQLRAIIAGISGGSTGAGGGTLTPAEHDAIVAEVLAYMETVYGESLRQTQPGGQAGDGDAFTVVRAFKGQTLYGSDGAELILRSGKATVVAGANGLCDITAGVDVLNGGNVITNHLLIVPVGDGRGFAFSTDVYVMVRGGYYLVE